MSDASVQKTWHQEQESTPYEEPRGDIEKTLGHIWAETFGLERVGRADNYFGLGGNSLLAMTLMRRTSARFDLDLPVVVLFQFPTIPEMAEVIESLLSDGEPRDDVDRA
jgi:hypothetical protein